MTTKERKILIGFSVLVTVIVLGSLVDSVGGQLRPAQPSIAPYTPSYTAPPARPGLGETPGFPKLSAAQIYEFRRSAKESGISEQEMERLRVQSIHAGMYPEDGLGGKNTREVQREHSRNATGFYEPDRK